MCDYSKKEEQAGREAPCYSLILRLLCRVGSAWIVVGPLQL